MPEDANTTQAEAAETESQVTIAAVEATATEEPQSVQGDTKSTLSAEERAQAIELIAAANPGIVPELLAGETLAELTASIEPAKSAYQKIAERLGHTAAGAAVPSGSTVAVDPGSLSPTSKIAEGLKRQR